MNMKLESVTRFDKGIAGNIDSVFHQHFDIFSDPHRLIPYRSTEAEANATSAANLGTYYPRHFLLAKSGKMYALGNNLSGKAQILEKADPTTGTWGLSTTAASANNLIYGSFIEWAGALWYFTGTASVTKWVTATNTLTDGVSSITLTTITSVAHAVIGADDNMYMFYNNKVVKVTNAGVVSDNILTNLPSDMRIVSACRWGSYIAIGMAYGTSAIGVPSGVSKVFIWDMVTTTTVNDVVDWGEGALRVLGNIEGRLVGVSDKYLTSSTGLTSLAVGQGAMVVRMWAGATPQVKAEIVANQSVTADTGTFASVVTRFQRDVVVKDNRMYWVASVPFGASTSTESTYHLGIWAFGRKDVNSDFALSLDYVEEAVDTANYYINSFGNAGNYWFISHGAAGLVHKTDDAANYTNTSVYEKVFGNGKDTFKIKGITAMFDALPSAGQVALSYKKDEETSFSNIFVFGTDNALRHSATSIENLTAGGDTVTLTIASPCVVTLTAHRLVAGNIIRFSTTGALPTGITAGLDYYVISTGLATNTFRFSATSEGSAVNTSGTQSGTHTLDRTRTLPTYKKIRIRAESTGGAVLTGIAFLPEYIADDNYA